jgi:hypothetical protein
MMLVMFYAFILKLKYIDLPVVFWRIHWVLAHAICEAQIAYRAARGMTPFFDRSVVTGNMVLAIKRRLLPIESITLGHQ